MQIDLNIVIIFVSFILAIIGLFMGIQIRARLLGKLKTAITTLIFAIGFIILKDALKIINNFYLAISGIEYIRNAASIISVILILITMLQMKSMINGIDGHCKKRKI